MTQFRKSRANPEVMRNSGETDALLFENAELRKTAAELMLQTTILREALLSGRTKMAPATSEAGLLN